MPQFRKLCVFLVLLLIASTAAIAQDSTQRDSTQLEKQFKTPPDVARPFVWWHWMNGNVTREGITADMEWMKRVGIGGVVMFDGSLGTPQFVPKRLVWMTPDWKLAFRHAASEADRLGLTMNMAASGGWSESGGPWVKPEQGMKKYVWSETALRGPMQFSGLLTTPPSVSGVYQNLERGSWAEQIDNTLPGAIPFKPDVQAPEAKFYADTKVIAFRTPEAELTAAHPKVTSNVAGLDLAALTDGDITKSIEIPVGKGAETWIQFEYAEPFAAAALHIAGAGGGLFTASALPYSRFEASNDGSTWVRLLSLPGTSHPWGSFPVRTYAFPQVSYKLYRLTIEAQPDASRTSVPLAEVELLSAARVNYWEAKAQFETFVEFETVATPHVPAKDVLRREDIIDLTSKMKSDGTLAWDVPAGNWTVLRMGYSLTGQRNAPASPEATGLEADKLSPASMNAYLDSYTAQVSGALGPFYGKSFKGFLMDSWEAGNENWTDELLKQFEARRGYSAVPYLPVLTGRVVESADVSDRFLWDFRRTIADLLAEAHYGGAWKKFQSQGLEYYAEAMGGDAPTTGDGLQTKGNVGVPMGEFWTNNEQRLVWTNGVSDIQEAASAAHIYGKRLAAAESFTTGDQPLPWEQGPFFLKPFADRAFAAGINKMMIHTSVHQPFVDDAHKPGMTLGPYGQHFTRNNTWAEQARAWIGYLTRNSYMLQQGLFVADVAYYYGEDGPVTTPGWKNFQPEAPEGYSFDWINSEVLLTRMTVKDGRLMLPDGMSYRVLVLPAELHRLTLPVVRKLRELVAAGAVVMAARPGKSPSLADYPAGDEEIRLIANEVWGAADGQLIRQHAYGKGRVYWGTALPEILEKESVQPDVQYTHPSFDTDLTWIHRRTADADIYFIANQRKHAEDLTVSLRTSGKEAELWDSNTGETAPAAYEITGDRTQVPLHFDPFGSTFIVFRHAAASASRTLPKKTERLLATVEGAWDVMFPAGWGAPAKISLPKLESWSKSADAGVKYFSGTATYSRQLDLPTLPVAGERILLDLGEVREVAEVTINGKAVPEILWKAPFRADITDYIHRGANRIEIKVTNVWANRIIGDQQPGAGKRYTFTDYRPFKKESLLVDSGLLGPVRLLVESAAR